MGYNMSYCRNTNTLGALSEAWDYWYESDVSDVEERAQKGLKRLIHEMYWEFRDNGDYPEDEED